MSQEESLRLGQVPAIEGTGQAEVGSPAWSATPSFRARVAWDRWCAVFFRGTLGLVHLLALGLLLGLLWKSFPLLGQLSFGELFFSTAWHPLKGQYGFLAFIVGTLGVTLIAMGIAAPLSLLAAIYLSEYAGKRTRSVAIPFIQLLAGIPSVLFGLWGMLALVPGVRLLGTALGFRTTGYCLLSGGLVLSLMVCPIVISVAWEILQRVPMAAREAALSLGLTRWETTRHVLLKLARRGLVVSLVLGCSRALGETMAVLMVVGNVARLPESLFSPVYPLPSLIANNYGEVMSIPRFDSALMLAALILMCVVTAFNLGARALLQQLERGWRS